MLHSSKIFQFMNSSMSSWLNFRVLINTIYISAYIRMVGGKPPQ